MDAESLLWYQQPATDFDHALPVGNGRIGGMIFNIKNYHQKKK